MRNFVIFFQGKEGTSPLVRVLNNFDRISVIHQMNNKGWEPFDSHNCGAMPLESLERCLDIVFSKSSIDFQQLNRIYTKTSARPLEVIDGEIAVVGFKMRFQPPIKDKFSPIPIFWRYQRFKRMMINLLRKNNVVVLFAVRQDVLRWALSKYHGDGFGRSGHLQFKLANGEISKDEISKIHVDCTRLEKIINECERAHTRKYHLMQEFKLAGIESYSLLYENFLNDKQEYFYQILNYLQLESSPEEIDAALNLGTYFKKVHSDDISDFVENYEEVQEKFGNRFVSWT